MIKAVIFDCFGVLYVDPDSHFSAYLRREVRLVRNDALLDYAEVLRKTYKVALLSNLSPAAVNTYFTQGDRERYFDAVVVSGDVGVTKPHPDIYHLTAERLGIEPNEAVFIDDSAENCEGARAVGMQAVQYRNLEQLQKDLGEIV